MQWWGPICLSSFRVGAGGQSLGHCCRVAYVCPAWVPHHLRVVTFSSQLSSIDLNDQVEGDDRAFEVWHEREDSVRKYLLQARTVIIKNSWVKEICGIQQRLAQPVWRECPFVGHSAHDRMGTRPFYPSYPAGLYLGC